jgi:hypothetical protein
VVDIPCLHRVPLSSGSCNPIRPLAKSTYAESHKLAVISPTNNRFHIRPSSSQGLANPIARIPFQSTEVIALAIVPVVQCTVDIPVIAARDGEAVRVGPLVVV